MKNLVKTIIFLLIFCMLWSITFKFFWVDKTPISLFYKQPKNHFDVMYYGSSNAYIHFNTTLAYDKYGFTTGLMSTDSQPFGVIKYLIKETKKYQKPKLYVIDIFKITDDLKEIGDPAIRKSTDSMKFSMNRIDAINELLTYNNTDKSEYINYYFSFLMYHNSWKKIANVSDNNIGALDSSSLYKGYGFGSDQTAISVQKDYVWNDAVVELPKKNEEILIDLIDYIKSNNLNVIFIVPSRTLSEIQMGRINDAINIIKKNNFNIINFNDLNDFKIDYSKDLYNSTHLNVYGATKYTLYFSKYLHENYDLPNHKNDKNYISWEEEYMRFKNDFNKITKTDFDELISLYQY